MVWLELKLEGLKGLVMVAARRRSAVYVFGLGLALSLKLSGNFDLGLRVGFGFRMLQCVWGTSHLIQGCDQAKTSQP